MPLTRTDLGGEAVGPLVALQLTQVYGYANQQCDHVLEAVCRFPLPGDAAVSGVRLIATTSEPRVGMRTRLRGCGDNQFQKEAENMGSGAVQTYGRVEGGGRGLSALQAEERNKVMKMSEGDIKRYSKLAYYVKNNLPDVVNVPAIRVAMSKIGQISL